MQVVDDVIDNQEVEVLVERPVLLSEQLQLEDGINLCNYESNLQKKFEHVKKELEKDPNYVAYDWMYYVNKFGGIVKREAIISTNGDFMTLRPNNKVYVRKGTRTRSGYWEIRLYRDNPGNTPGHDIFQLHRAVAATFIVPPTGSCIIFNKLEANHEDGNKDNNHFSNLTWMTRKENLNHAIDNGLIKSGIAHENTIPLMGEITMPCKWKGQKFIVAGDRMFLESGLVRHSIVTRIPEQRTIYGCLWSYPTQEELSQIQMGVPDGYMDYYRANKSDGDSKVKPVIGKILKGPYKDHEFYLLGATEVAANGFVQAWVSKAARKIKPDYKGIEWRYGTHEEVEGMERGITEEMKATIK